MLSGLAAMDPTTVLSSVVTGLSKLQVRVQQAASRGEGSNVRCAEARGPCPRLPQVNNSAAVSSVSEPTTPSESPQSLDSGLRDWLTETLSESGRRPALARALASSRSALTRSLTPARARRVLRRHSRHQPQGLHQDTSVQCSRRLRHRKGQAEAPVGEWECGVCALQRLEA